MFKARMPLYFLLVIFMISCKKDSPIDPTPIPPSSGLQSVMNIPFSEGQGSQVVESKTSTNLTVTGRGLNWTQGVSNSSFYFDGLSNVIDGEISSNILPKERFVISVWVAPKTYPLADAGIVAFTEQNSSTGVTLALTKFGQLKFQYFINGAYAQIVSNQSISRSEWSHIVGVINTSTRKVQLYINGELDNSANVPSGDISWKSSSNPIRIGQHTNDEKIGLFNVDFFSGLIDELEILSGEVTEEILEGLFAKFNRQSTVAFDLNIDYSGDQTRPIYHPIQETGWANEAYGLIKWNNEYHMFFQKNEVFLGIAQQNWGHFKSTDLLHWEEQEPILWPSVSFDSVGTWSGCSFVVDGVPYVAYTGVDGTIAGIGLAKTEDNFNSLDKIPNNPVINRAPTSVDLDFRDPFVWKEADQYHMIIGSGKSSLGGNVVLYTSQDGISWAYQGIPFQGVKGRGDGNFWEMPVMVQFDNGKYALVVQNTPEGTPARTMYWIGDYTNNSFTPDHYNPKYLEVINGFLSPTVFKEQDGKIIAVGIIPDEVNAEHHLNVGWANLFSLTQEWSLNNQNEIEIKPHENLADLRKSELFSGVINVSESESNYLSSLSSKHYEISAQIDMGTSSEFGFILGRTPNAEEYVTLGYNATTQEWFIDTTKSSLSDLVRRDLRKGIAEMNNSQLFDLRIFVDGSVIEAFIDDQHHFTGRFFPTFKNADGIDVYSKGGSAQANLTIYSLE